MELNDEDRRDGAVSGRKKTPESRLFPNLNKSIDTGIAMSAPNAEQVHAILAATYLGDPAARGEAERTLKEVRRKRFSHTSFTFVPPRLTPCASCPHQLENVPTFPSILLHLLAEPTVEDPVKQAGTTLVWHGQLIIFCQFPGSDVGLENLETYSRYLPKEQSHPLLER